MLNEVGSYDAKTKLPEILRKVESGQTFTITNRGKPIADLIPSKAGSHERTVAAINNILKAKKHKISNETLADLKESGRK